MPMFHQDPLLVKRVVLNIASESMTDGTHPDEIDRIRLIIDTAALELGKNFPNALVSVVNGGFENQNAIEQSRCESAMSGSWEQCYEFCLEDLERIESDAVQHGFESYP